MRRFCLYAMGAALLSASPAYRAALAHSEADQEDKGGIGSSGTPWSVHGEYRDIHTLPHGQEQIGEAQVTVVVTSAPSFRKTTGPEGPTALYSLKAVASLSTPLTGLFRAQARPGNVNGTKGYRGFASTLKRWKEMAPPRDADGQIFLAFGVSHTGRRTHVGHRKGPTAVPVAVPVEDACSVIDTGGTPAVVLDGESGAVLEIVRDENGDIVWDVPPVPLVRLTSSLTEAGGIFTYVYKVENLGADPIDFTIPEITTPAYPAGWYGTVNPSSFDQIILGSTSIPYSQHATFSITETDEEYSSEQVTTAEVYAPEDRLAFGGTCTITGAYYDPVLQANVIEFIVTDHADLALLLRADPAGEETVADLEGPVAGLPCEMLDDTFLPGPNDYRVRAGSGVNGWQQPEATRIVN